jgi:hypothetical protein
MKIDAIKLGAATAIIFAVIWVVCSVLVLFVPGAMMQMSGHMLHADLGNMGWTMHWVGFLTGLILWTLLPALLVTAIAAIYNRFVD